MSLFAPNPEPTARQRAPLAERMRPRTLDEFFGQTHLLAPGKPLQLQIERDDAASLIFWGPPGVGKTTLAKIVAGVTSATFIEFSAVLSGIKEIKQVMVDAEKAATYGSRTVLFVDEIHRFNKAQQDAFLPYVERGSIRLIGATTENPSFEINAALLSRCRVYTLRALSQQEILALLQRALTDTERGLGALGLTAEQGSLETIASYSSGDARNALNALDVAASLVVSKPVISTGAALTPPQQPVISTGAAFIPPLEPVISTGAAFIPPLEPVISTGAGRLHRPAERRAPRISGPDDTATPDPPPPLVLTQALVAEALQQRVLLYDKKGEQHYDLISALHKSVRNSDPDAALYWLGRMLAAGEDPMYVARRVVRMSFEDIGLAAPEALNLCLSARDAMHFLGSPEGDLALAQAVVYLALAPKSNAVYTAYGAVLADIESRPAEPVPLHLRNAPTRLMKELDYGKGYQYAHDLESKVAAMQCLPDDLRERRYYHPTQEGRERLLAQRMEELARLRDAGR